MTPAIRKTIFWILAAVVFNILIYVWMGPTKAFEFASGYIVEKSLSVDNLFVFTLIFGYFRIQPKNQNYYLTWGIIGAFVLRGILILLGAALISQFEWILYIFGGILCYSAYKLLFFEESDENIEESLVIKLTKKYLPGSLVVIGSIEICDVIFALDSIPAIFAITQDPFIVFTSNMFAILGLRSLYFVLVDMLERFEYLNYGVASVLMFIGLKLLLMHFFHIPTVYSLIFIVLTLGGSILLSFVKTREETI